MKKSPFFSIIIPALNEEKYLPLLLADLASQSFTDFEVIVVDGQSEDTTVNKAKKFSSKLNLHLFSTPTRGVSHQRNLGAKKAQANWLLFMDADNRLPTFFLQGIKYQLEKHPSVDIFTCWLEPTSYSVQDRLLIQLSNVGMELYSKVKPIATGALIGCQKLVSQKVQFDETLKYSEDHAFVLGALEKGFDFHIFREPRFIYSLRRFKKEGTLKILRTYAKLNLQYLLGKEILTTEYEYPMNGGSYYSLTKKKHFSWLEYIQHQLSNLTKTQKTRIQKMLEIIDLY